MQSTLQQFVTTSDGQSLWVNTWGDASKPALVLVHGYPDNQTVWEPIIAQLTAQFYVVTYDVRGAGRSSIPSKVRDYQLPRLSLDLQSVVDAVLEQRPFHLAAHDWGSIQSWESVTESRFKNRILSYSSISGPCLDHAAFWLRHQAEQSPRKLIKQLSKSWYIAAFHLPLFAPTLWKFLSPERWGKVLSQMERKGDLPLNDNVSADGQYGIALYRANFIPRLLQPRQRFAVCPVQAVVLKYDNFVSPELIDEYPRWVADFSRVDVAANHWAVLSQPQLIANYIAQFALQHQPK